MPAKHQGLTFAAGQCGLRRPLCEQGFDLPEKQDRAVDVLSGTCDSTMYLNCICLRRGRGPNRRCWVVLDKSHLKPNRAKPPKLIIGNCFSRVDPGRLRGIDMVWIPKTPKTEKAMAQLDTIKLQVAYP